MKAAARLIEVTKRYGLRLALDEMSFEIPQGVICGLVGPNGSGKTTTMGVLAGLLRVEKGTVDLLGDGPFSVESHAGRVGIMPQDSEPSPYASIVDSLTYFAQLQGMNRRDARAEAEKWLALVRLEDRGRSRYGTLSHGMRRRFSLAQAMLGSPEFVLLDEPTSGLDPELVVEIREMIVQLRGKSTVLVSSHVLSELETMCDHVIFVEKGRCVRQGPMRTITGEDSVVRYRLDRQPDIAALRDALFDCKIAWKGDVLSIHGPSNRSVVDINTLGLRLLLDAGVGIIEVTAGESLESAYLGSKSS